ncbi:MAG: ethanolamine ammonia-lyase reactivating factor EutA [Lachnospiraceae bacterium]
MAETILSAGIDIGTTTTQLIFSRLTLEKTGGFGTAPKVEVVNRDVIYRSEIYFTPLTAEDTIDAGKVARLIQKEYEKANIKPSDLETGAVIITGESAKKRNAEEVTLAMAELAGEFVVAAAGPDLESMLAGKGAGAGHLSEVTGKSVLNIDIGGGTSNLCLFEDGIETDCACFDIGGRVIRLDQNHRIEKISPKIEVLLTELGINIKAGDLLTVESGKKIAMALSDILAEGANLKPAGKIKKFFETNHGLSEQSRPLVICFSGGVADCINRDFSDPFLYGDIGILLGEAIRENPVWHSVEVCQADETMRATVIGAGNCSMEVSGSTIFARGAQFPIKNLPVIKLVCDSEKQIETINKQLSALKENGMKNYEKGFALAIAGPVCPSFTEVEKIADMLSTVLMEEKNIVPVVLEYDFAKALGQAIRRRVPKEKAILCLDGVACQNGDFIDIGKPVGEGAALPVIVKTLIFSEDRRMDK